LQSRRCDDNATGMVRNMATKTTRDLAQWVRELDEQIAELSAKRDALKVALAFGEAREAEEEKENAPAKMLRNSMLQLLAEHGRPMHYVDIYRKLVEQGVDVPGKDPRRNVGAHLSNDPRFENTGSGEWGLVSWRYRPPKNTPESPHPRIATSSEPDGGVSSDGRVAPWREGSDPLGEDESRVHLLRMRADSDDVPF
jgi:hypothetical protein